MDRLLRHAVIASAAVHLVAAAALHPAEREARPLPVIEARLLATIPGPEPALPAAKPPVQPLAAATVPTTTPRRSPPVLATAAPASHSAPQPAAMPVETAAPPTAVPVAVVAAAAPVAVLAPPRYDAAYLANPPPPYPASARRRGIEGTVTIEVRVSPAGEAREVKLAATAGDAALDQAALEAVQGWRFIPARRGDQAVEAWVRIPLIFRLN